MPARAGYLAIQQALSAIDRMEVRGRDSAGIHVFVWHHGLDLDDPAVAADLAGRGGDPLFQSGSARAVPNGSATVLSFVYKAAAEIGELGDNTATMRAAVAGDRLLRLAMSGPGARVSVLGHTRWASVGIISEPNAHPVNSDEIVESERPYCVGVLNGDVDNHADLKVEHELRFAGPITTDAKVIPALFGHHADALGAGGGDLDALVEAFRRTVSGFDGSVAIGAMSAAAPGRVLLALRGSGQGVYVGFAEDRFIVASEPYGIVEETRHYLRLDGETGGQLVCLDADRAGSFDGVTRLAYDGTPLPVGAADLSTTEVTTRDIDLGEAPHFLLKEISESPESFAKTLRGKISTDAGGRLRAAVGGRALPADIAAATGRRDDPPRVRHRTGHRRRRRRVDGQDAG